MCTDVLIIYMQVYMHITCIFEFKMYMILMENF